MVEWRNHFLSMGLYRKDLGGIMRNVMQLWRSFMVYKRSWSNVRKFHEIVIWRKELRGKMGRRRSWRWWRVNNWAMDRFGRQYWFYGRMVERLQMG